MSEAAQEMQRHPTLYKATGDIVVSATSGGSTHLFRVHTVILAEHSPVFAGMLALPKGPNVGMQTYDGVPAVHLPDDAEDVASLFKLLYSPGYVCLEFNFSRALILGIEHRSSRTTGASPPTCTD